jgi:HK97 family phage major capsid protein/HK97 family phage prohead protease
MSNPQDRQEAEPLTMPELSGHLIDEHGVAVTEVADQSETYLTQMHVMAHNGGVAPSQTTTGPDTLASAELRDSTIVVVETDDDETCPACDHPADCVCTTCDCTDPIHPQPAMTSAGRSISRPPRDNLVRSAPPVELRETGAAMPTMVGHFARFNEWTTIDSQYEGRFRERVAPGAFKRTFANSNGSIKALFQHGKDPTLGDQILGPIEVLREDSDGAYYEVPLLEGIPPLIFNGIKAKLYGASFRFSVLQEDVNTKAKRSAENPEGLPERTIREARVMEFGPVTFPAYAGATASVRSLTDDFLREVLIPAIPEPAALVVDPGAEPHIEATRNDPAPSTPLQAQQEPPVSDPISRVDRPSRMAEIRARTEAIATEHAGVLPASIQAEWDGLTAELTSLEADDRADALRRAFVEQRSATGESGDGGVAVAECPPYQVPVDRGQIRQRVSNIYSLSEHRQVSRDEHDERQLLRDSAMREIEKARFPSAINIREDSRAAKAKCADAVADLVNGDRSGEMARRVLITGDPAYRRDLGKYIVSGIPSPFLMERAAALTGLGATTTTGGYATVYELDPTILPTSNGAVNPFRRMARVVKTTKNEWRGVTSAGVVAVYDTEAATATEQGPTLAQPAAIVQKAQTFITFSIEAGEDIDNLEGQLAGMIQDSKDVLESAKFTTGAGTTVFPQGVLIGATNTFVTATTLVLAAADLYKVEGLLPPRFRANSRFLANRFIYNKVRAIDTAGGAQLWTQNLTVGLPNRVDGNTGYNLLGYPADECSGYVSTIAQNDLIMTLGDFNYFVIVDKIGLNIETVPLMMDGSTPSFPTGQRGLYAYWRNTSKVLSAAAFETIKVA